MANTLKYSTRQNVEWFLQALMSLNNPSIKRPRDCPEYRWLNFRTEARRSLPTFESAINELARTPVKTGKRVHAVCIGAQ